jgi:predicted membrane-bound spermidine synthase
LTTRFRQNIFNGVQESLPTRFIRPTLFLLFFVSGFCGLVYQVVWTRMAFAAFGIIMPVLSVVLAVFMLGLALGSVAGGKWIPALVAKTRLSAAAFYALAEFLIGVGAFAVPKLFDFGTGLLLAAGQMNSFGYLSLSALVLAVSIFPFCFFMGVTFPFMMAYIREGENPDAQSFSFLYTANVLGAMSGTLLTALVLIEMFGFGATLRIAATGNFCIALVSAALAARQRPAAARAPEKAASDAPLETPARARAPFIRWILFSTGFCAMAMEVVWTRQFTPVLKTQVYSFALIVFAYLGATFAGSLWYRHHVRRNSVWPVAKLMGALILAVFLPVLIVDPRFVKMSWQYDRDVISAIFTLLSICPFCAALGYLTPSLVDSYSQGNPTRAGAAYAINVTGCILGPLLASYILLPEMSERHALILLGLPFFAFYFAGAKSLPLVQRTAFGSAACVVAAYSLFCSQDFEDYVASKATSMEIRRDYAASVVAINEPGPKAFLGKSLLVNGIGMTKLLPVTKFMVHLPLALHQGTPQSALIICFGMGTSYRSALSWDIDTTAVELIPAVPQVFGFYHTNAADVLQNPKGHIVIDDGRRFLKRTRKKYDLIVVDPPPPVEAAGSSLLYSTEMYALLKEHLNPHGIVQIWYPGGPDPVIREAVIRSATVFFPHVRCFGSIAGWGIHILASMDPIELQPATQLVARMPAGAKKDLLEWSPTQDLPSYMGVVLDSEIPLQSALNPNSQVLITDDDPLNEYFLLRRAGLF